ncbi:MAG: HipA domain-containing protein, partial [Cyanobacteria bacterium P01_F01_bin.42]
ETEIERLLQGYATSPLGMIQEADDFRISIAGAQEKTALLWHQEQWCRPIGSTPTSHIFKLPIGKLENQGIDLSDSCENEWLCLKIAEAFCFPVANPQIQTFKQVKVLILERFDRQWSKDGTWLMRLPQEDMCQALGISPGLKYQADDGPGVVDIMNLLLGAEDADGDRECFLRSQILFWLLAAIDGHGKNFSIYLRSGGSFRLTPLYDIISAYPLMKTKAIARQKAKMAMAVTGKKNYYQWSMIQPRHFISTAIAAGFSGSRVDAILHEMLKQVPDVIETVTQQLPADFPPSISQPIFNGMRSLAERHYHVPVA